MAEQSNTVQIYIYFELLCSAGKHSNRTVNRLSMYLTFPRHLPGVLLFQLLHNVFLVLTGQQKFAMQQFSLPIGVKV